MKRDVRQEIIRTAETLFKESGYDKVSMREISQSLQISVGNLNYYFKKKEDLLEAVIMNIHNSHGTLCPPSSLEELNTFLMEFFQILQKHAAYFKDFMRLSRISKKICDLQTADMKHFYHIMAQVFQQLHAAGYIIEELLPDQYSYFAQVILMTCVYWTPQQRIQSGLELEPDFFSCIWSILFPLLTDRGKTAFRSLISADVPVISCG